MRLDKIKEIRANIVWHNNQIKKFAREGTMTNKTLIEDVLPWEARCGNKYCTKECLDIIKFILDHCNVNYNLMLAHPNSNVRKVVLQLILNQ